MSSLKRKNDKHIFQSVNNKLNDRHCYKSNEYCKNEIELEKLEKELEKYNENINKISKKASNQQKILLLNDKIKNLKNKIKTLKLNSIDEIEYYMKTNNLISEYFDNYNTECTDDELNDYFNNM